MKTLKCLIEHSKISTKTNLKLGILDKMNQIIKISSFLLAVFLLLSCEVPEVAQGGELSTPVDFHITVESPKKINPLSGKKDVPSVPTRVLKSKVEAVWFGKFRHPISTLDIDKMFFKLDTKEVPNSWGFGTSVKESYFEYVFHWNVLGVEPSEFQQLIARALKLGLVKKVNATITHVSEFCLHFIDSIELQDGEKIADTPLSLSLLKNRISASED